jgi:hypothetical protein
LADEDIIEEILGGGTGGVKTNKDIWKLEDEKMQELMAEMERVG